MQLLVIMFRARYRKNIFPISQKEIVLTFTVRPGCLPHDYHKELIPSQDKEVAGEDRHSWRQIDIKVHG